MAATTAAAEGEEPHSSRYQIRDLDILRRLTREHVSRYDRMRDWRTDSGYHVTLDDPAGDGIHVYDITADGIVERTPADEEDPARRETIADNLFTALVGRANKTAEFVDELEAWYDGTGEVLDEDVVDTVLARYTQGPVLEPDELYDTIVDRYGNEAAATVRTEQPDRFLRAQQYAHGEVPEHVYRNAVAKVVDGAPYDEGFDLASVIDFEIVTKGRSMADFYSDTQYGEDFRHIYRGILAIAVMKLQERRPDIPVNAGNWLDN